MLQYHSLQKRVEKTDHFTLPSDQTIIWLHIDEASKNNLAAILAKLQLHPLAKRAMIQPSHFPRMDVYQNEAFISSFALKDDYTPVHVKILVGKNYVISCAEVDLTLFPDLEKDFADHPEHMSDTGHILYHILDKIVMSHLRIVDKMANEIQGIEKQVFKTPFANEIGQSIFRWKAKLHQLRQIIEAQENVIQSVGRSSFPYINENAGFYFQDLENNFARVVSAFDTFKESLAGIFDLQMSLKSDHMNAIMKTLTLVSVIFLPMTFIAGVYGMNFEVMPELKWRFGYAYALILMFGIGLSIAAFFKNKGWW